MSEFTDADELCYVGEIDRLRKENKKMLDALEEIDKWWDTTDSSRVIPALDPGNSIPVRNDSMAAGSILCAKMLLKSLKK